MASNRKRPRWGMGSGRVFISMTEPEEINRLGTDYGRPTMLESDEEPEIHSAEKTIETKLSEELGMNFSPFVAETHVIKPFAEEIADGTLVASIVGRIVTPGDFWVMPLQFYNDLENLMKEMQRIYRKVDTSAHLEQCIPQMHQMHVGMCVVVKLDDGDWHRGLVVDINNTKETVVVRAIDFGDMEEVPRDRVRFLFRQFALLKAQAIPCIARMSTFYMPKIPGRNDINLFVKMDRGNEWAKIEGDLFRNIIFNRPVMIRFLNRENGDPELWRTRNLQPWTVYIHLPKEGLTSIEIPHVEREVFSRSRGAPYCYNEIRQEFVQGEKAIGINFNQEAGLDTTAKDNELHSYYWST